MRICYVAYPNSLKLRSANAVQTYATLRALKTLAPDTLAIVPRIESGPGAFDGLALHLPRIGIGRLSRVYRSTLWYYAERSAYAWMVLALLTWLRLARRQRFDVIYVREVICALWLALLAPRLTGARVVYEVHDLESRNPSRAKEGWAQPLLHLIDRLTLTRPAALTSLTATFRDMLASTGLRDPCEVAVLPDAYDETRYAPQDCNAARRALGLPDEPTIVYAGLTFAYRGVDLLLNALVDTPGARLILVGGRDAERTALAGQAQRLGIGERVTFIGTQPQDRVPLYLAAADVLVIPDTVTDVTASPLKLFEYMAMERAVVCPDLPALREITGGDGALHVPRGDVAALAAALRTLLDDSALRQTLAQRGRERVAPYTYTWRAARLIAVCERVAQARDRVCINEV
ncbi:MAG: glycosyltransferase [Roseiflexus sp.]|jgi:glycosyltransferase involved in cell wall biosynthesis|uniref:glycosyltransferase n=1 Tax=Roseiflexus sp. TaxID=2562120 RepID=UPI0025FD0E03|nr:glycosyltransferase [Roseiflexus sp.]MCL6541725.1 glycosyltransferase [Roseiflexus sp.]